MGKQLNFSKAIMDTAKGIVSSSDCEYCQWIRSVDPDPEYAFCRIHGDVVPEEKEHGQSDA